MTVSDVIIFESSPSFISKILASNLAVSLNYYMELKKPLIYIALIYNNKNEVHGKIRRRIKSGYHHQVKESIIPFYF
jgi:inner membrane protein involved in colicin E2 resistance